MMGKKAGKAVRKPGHAGILILVLSVVLSACSAGLFDSPDSNGSQYKPINTACDAQFSSQSLDAPTLRAMVHCFDAYGGLKPIDQLLASLSDQDLQPIADFVSDYVLKQPQTLYGLDQSFQMLDSQGKLDEAFANLGKLLKNDEFLVSALTLLKEAYYEPSSFPASWFHDAPADPRVLVTFRYLAQKLTAPNVGTGIDVGLTLVSAPAFNSLQGKFRQQSPGTSSLQEITDSLLGYAQNSGVPEESRVPVGRMLLEGLIREDLFRAVDQSIGGDTSDGIQNGTDRASSVLREILNSDGAIFNSITAMFKALHGPVSCLKGTQRVPDGDMYILSEIARQNSSDVGHFLRVTDPLALITVNPLCDYPAGLASNYWAIQELSSTNTMEPAADLVKAFFGPVGISTERPLAELFIGMMADDAIRKLTPGLSELNHREAFDDLILLASLPRVEDRGEISNAVKYIYDPIPELGNNTSAYDILVDATQRISPASLFRFVSSLKNFVDSDDLVFQPGLKSLRDFYYVNDAHPVVDVLQKVLLDAPKRPALFTTLFKMVDMKEFQDSVKLVSVMATDGRLKQITSGILDLYRRISQTGQIAIHPVKQPIFVAKSRHSLMERDLKPFPILVTPPDPSDPCSKLDLTFGMDQFGDPKYDEKLNNTVECLAQNTQDPTVLEDVQYLRSVKSEENGWDFFRLPIELIKTFNPTAPELRYFSDAWLRSYDSGYFLNLMNAVPFFVDQVIAPSGVGAQFDPGPVLRPLFDLADPMISGDSRAKLAKLEKFVATEIRRDDFPKTLEVAHEISQKALEPVDAPVVTQFDRERIERWVRNKECERTESTDAQLRATQIIDDFDNSVDNWSVQDGRPKRSYSVQDAKGLLGDTVTKLARPELNAPDQSLLQALLNIMRYFTLEPGQAPDEYHHYTAGDLIKWIKDRSEDYRLITFYYQDEYGNMEKYPRVKLANTLDLIELVPVVADFQVNMFGYQIIGNSSLEFTAELGQAWGDEPRELWPEKIKELYPPGTPIKKIKDVIDEMFKSQRMFADIVGYPTLPNCQQVANPNDPPDVQQAETSWPKNATGKHLPEWGVLRNIERELYNMQQVLAILEENRPLDPGEDPSHHLNPAHAGGLKIMRDVMYELYFSTPAAYRSYQLPVTTEWRNNLKVADSLSRFGSLRVLGQRLRQFAGNEKALHDVFKGFLSAATLPQTKDALTALFVNNPDQTIFWSTLEKIFSVFDSAEGNYTEAQKGLLASLSPPAAAAQQEEWVRDAGRMKQLGFYALGLAQSFDLAGPAMGSLATMVNDYGDYLAAHMDKLESILRSQSGSYFLRGLYEEPSVENQTKVIRIAKDALADPALLHASMDILKAIDKDANAQNAWSLFSNRKDVLESLPEFQPYRQSIDQFKDDLIFFFADQSADPDEILASDHFRHYFADLLEQGEIDQFLILAKADPDKFYQVLRTLSGQIKSGRLQDFFGIVRRSLSDPTR